MDGADSFLAYHGTNPEAAEQIQREGFRVGTWFAFEREVAERFGICIFTVRLPRERLNDHTFDGSPEEWWQFHTLEPIPVEAIVSMEETGQSGWAGWGAVLDAAMEEGGKADAG